MATDLFDSSLQNLEFDTETSLRRAPLPNELPPPPNLRGLPKDLLKSTTIENLISQNEDLMARLKVALRRLSVLENENQSLHHQAEEARHHRAVSEDQTLVLKEKDQAWKSKVDQALAHQESLKEKIRLLQDKLQGQETELNRHRKYHEKIKTQVKPHLIQLKEYANSLEQKQGESESLLSRKEAQVRDLRDQIIEVTKNSRYQVEQAESRNHDLVSSYEKTVREMRTEIESLREINQDLDMKASRLRRSEQRCDELENENVELRRSKDELSKRFEKECQRLMERGETLAREAGRLNIENEDLKAKALSDYDRLKELEQTRFDLQSQLESLRYLWSTRNEENEKLKLSLSALERLNIDLSSKLQELRSSAASSTASST